jgi:8-oxo-dGTP pyrophosphatase MutT (NUDIX family)
MSTLDQIKENRVALVLATDVFGRVLFGKRNDNSRYTIPAGHLEPGEDPLEGAKRELLEETNLVPTSITFLKESPGPNGMKLFLFSALVQGTPSGANDPDQECEHWEFVDCRDGIPKNIYNNLHGPDDDYNIVRQVFDMKKSEHAWVGQLVDLKKSDSEIKQLLQHPDPNERALALKMKGVTPDDLALAILDPEPEVWMRAYQHSAAAHALDVLATSARDNAGNPIWNRHQLLMKDPRCTPWHLKSMRSVIEKSSFLPVQMQAQMLAELPLQKSEAVESTGICDWTKEVSDNYLDMDRAHQLPVAEGLEGYKPNKKVFQVEDRYYIVKPYSPLSSPLQGWAETTSQEIYKASGLGSNHQVSWVQGPEVVIEVTKTEAITDTPLFSPEAVLEAKKIGFLDFLCRNQTRNVTNLLVKSGHILATDHDQAFQYGGLTNDTLHHYMTTAVHVVAPDHDYEEVFDWWSQNSIHIKSAVFGRIYLISEKTGNFVWHGFIERLAFLDMICCDRPSNWMTLPYYDDSAQRMKLLTKALGSSDFLKPAKEPHPHLAVSSITHHLKAPESLSPHIEHYEKHLNGPEKHEPIMGQFTGVEPKAVYKHEDNHYLVKTAGSHKDIMAGVGSTAHGAWSEMTSQSMYHAGGIGHLHQKSHISPQAEGHHALVIHMDPHAMSLDQSIAADDSRAEGMFNHKADLKKIGLMDMVTDNGDRHGANLMLHPDGRPLAIDHGLAFTSDHGYAVDHGLYNNKDENNEVTSGMPNSATEFGGKPDQETWAWWDQNKDKIKQAFHNNVDLIQDPKYRSRMKESFEHRINHLESGRVS